jgi:GMP synthase PP-ATPase subunit
MTRAGAADGHIYSPSTDGMTLDFYLFDMAFWTRAPTASRLINEVESVNHVAYDMTSKPPGTIE